MNKDKLRYAILKAVDEGIIRKEFLTSLGLNDDEGESMLDTLNKRDFFDTYEYFYDGIEYETLELSEKGEQYLKDNSTLAKWYKGFKEVLSWIP